MAISKTTARKAKRQSEISHTVFETAPKAALLMLLTGLFILFFSALITLNLPSPAAFAQPIALTSLILGAAVGGCFCSKRLEVPNAYASGAFAVLFLIILLITAKFLIPTTVQSSSTAFNIIGYMLTAASAMAGVSLGSVSRKNRRRKKHYRS